MANQFNTLEHVGYEALRRLTKTLADIKFHKSMEAIEQLTVYCSPSVYRSSDEKWIQPIIEQLAREIADSGKTGIVELPLDSDLEAGFKVTDPQSNLSLRLIVAYDVNLGHILQFAVGLA